MFRQIQYDSPEYKQACVLRHQELRSPLGLDLYAENLAAEKDWLHFGLFTPAGNLTAYVLAVPLSPSSVKLRQMVVEPTFRGGGYGTALLQQVEDVLRNQGFTQISLNARKTAVGFYQKQGYQIDGDEFIEVTLLHYRMHKDIQ